MQTLKWIVIAGIFCCPISQNCRAQTGNAGFSIEGIESVKIPLTINKMTNIVFPTPIRPGIRLSRDIFGERPKGTTNVLLLKANRRGFAPTNLSVYGVDGRLYSFELRYEENPSLLMFRVTGGGVAEKMPLEKDAEVIGGMKPFLHHVVRADKMRLMLRGVYFRDGIMWFSLLLTNHSEIDYSPENIRWVIKDKRKLKRAAMHEIVVMPVYKSLSSKVAGRSSQVLIAGFQPVTLARNKCLVLQIDEKEGGRQLVLEMGRSLLIRLKPLEK